MLLNAQDKLKLSPSLYHKRLIQETKPSLAFDGGDFKKWQRRLRPKLRQLLAVPQNEHAPLRVKSLWKREHPLGLIEKIAFTSEPGSDVVAYFCLPKEARPAYQAMICLQGHTTGMHNSIGVEREDETGAIEVPGDRDFGLQCMQNGWAALCIEQRSFGLRREQQQEHICQSNTCHDAAMHALMLGRTLAGERVFDVDRGIDYLASRGDVDMKRIGVMGNSGGGTISIYSAALLDRVAFAMPSCAFATYRDTMMSIYHCADNYIPGILQYAEFADVLGLAAPKPLVVVAGKDDPIFPIKSVRKAFADLKKIYAAAGAEKACQLVIGQEGHRFYAEPAWKAWSNITK